MKVNLQISTLSDLSALFFALITFLFTVHQKFVPLAIGIWVLTCILSLFKNRIEFKPKSEYLLMITLYIFYIIGVAWSENEKEALFDLEVKMSLAIVPLIMMFVRYNRKHLKWMFYGFFLGILLEIIILLAQAGFRFSDSSSLESFFYTSLSPHFHPSYFSFYLNSAIGILLMDYGFRKINLFSRNWIYLLLIAIFCLFSFLLFSRIGVITTLLLVLFLFVLWVLKRSWKLLVTTVLLSISTTVVLYQSSELVRGRVGELTAGLEKDATNKWLESTSIRRVVWQEAYTVFKKHPLIGHGTGDVKDVLMAQYQEDKVVQLYKLNLNAHNQFIQTGIAIGIFGMLLLFLILILPIINAKRNFGYSALFSGIVLLFFITESVLETQAGVVGFVFFYTLLNSINNTLKTNDKIVDSNPILSA